MQVNGLAVALRPRPMSEATDLGVALVQTHARSIWRCYAPVWVVLTGLALAAVHVAPWLPALLIFWLKPWLDRTLLFVLSRVVFGQATHFGDVWRQRAQVWAGQPISTLLWCRFSPWRSYTQAIGQLEGQRGKAFWARRKQLLHARQGAAFGMQWVYSNVELALSLGFVVLLFWLSPQGEFTGQLSWMKGLQDSVSAVTVLALLQASVVLVVEPFFVAAGFAMYLNRRVELEAWDIEQEFRRAFTS